MVILITTNCSVPVDFTFLQGKGRFLPCKQSVELMPRGILLVVLLFWGQEHVCNAVTSLQLSFNLGKAMDAP